MNFNKIRIILVFLITANFQIYAQSSDKAIAGISLDRLEHYEEFISKEINQDKIPGATVLIVRDGKIVLQESYGHRDIENQSSMKTDDIFFIQSMTKPIITTAFMMLFEEGHFMLTDHVSKYLPEFKNLRVIKNGNDSITGETIALEKEITIEQLLTHTAGLTHGLGNSQFELGYRKEYFMQEWPDIKSRAIQASKLPLVDQPGNIWYYSVAPDIIATLIEKFSGMSTNDFLETRIFKPLKMKDTGYNLSKEQQGRVVKVTNKNNEGNLTNSDYQPPMKKNTIWSGVNGLFSTTSDYMTFCQMIMNNGQWNGTQFLSRKTIELMTQNHVGDKYPAAGVGFGYGFAVMLDVSKTNLLGSNGNIWWGGAFNTHFFIDPKEKLISIFMTQLNPYTNYYHDKMKQLVYQAIID
ncbi:serine hydrolase [Flavobacteriaceae bacterium]|jgi:CubicO group peptidase (beta-lactamase class C family)|nr:serine hydrolase [Flavobacteriaceae bacterium]